MAKINENIKNGIKSLTHEELEKLVLKAAVKSRAFHDYLVVNYIDKESGEKELFEKAKADIDRLMMKSYKGFSQQLRMANMLGACSKRIAEFSKICKNKNLEADLILYVLKEPFSYPSQFFGTCFTAFDYKVGLLVQRLITLVTKKMHEDFLHDYSPLINDYLNRLHGISDHVDTIYKLPAKI